MATLILLTVVVYIIYRYMSLKKLQKRIEILEKRADKLEKELRKLRVDLWDN